MKLPFKSDGLKSKHIAATWNKEASGRQRPSSLHLPPRSPSRRLPLLTRRLHTPPGHVLGIRAGERQRPGPRGGLRRRSVTFIARAGGWEAGATPSLVNFLGTCSRAPKARLPISPRPSPKSPDFSPPGVTPAHRFSSLNPSFWRRRKVSARKAISPLQRLGTLAIVLGHIKFGRGKGGKGGRLLCSSKQF